MKNTLIFISSLFFCLGGCHLNKTDYSIDNNDILVKWNIEDSIYPKSIVEKRLQKQYDEAKWNLYLFAVNDTPKDIEGNEVFSNGQTYSSFPIVFDSFYMSNDTFICYFNFLIRDSILTDEKIFNFGLYDVPNAVRVDSLTRCVYYKGKIGFDYTSLCSDLKTIMYPNDLSTMDKSQFLNSIGKLSFPLNQFILEYINTHQAELNPWFIKEAKKRGVIK